MNGPLVKVRDLSFAYEKVKVLNNISFECNKGEFIALVGPNGSGKSTLILTILGILKDFAGKIEISGSDIKSPSRQKIAQLVSYVPQDTHISFPFTVEDVVTMGRNPWINSMGKLSENDARVVEESMIQTSTLELKERSVHEISGGERQRVILARALAQTTPVILLDEPTANLDITHQLQIMELLREESDKGSAILASMHDLNMAARYADRVILLNNGYIEAIGSPAEVMTPELLQNVYNVNVSVGKSPSGKVVMEFSLLTSDK